MKFSISNLGAIDQAEVELGNLTLICGENNSGKTYVSYAIYGFLQFWHDGFHPSLPYEALVEIRDRFEAAVDISNYLSNPRLILDDACEEYTKNLPTVFASAVGRFKDTLISFSIDSQPAPQSFERLFKVGEAEFVVTKAEGATELLVSAVSLSTKMINLPLGMLRHILGRVLKDLLYGDSVPKAFIVSAERTGCAMFKNELNIQRNRLIEEIGRSAGDIDPFALITKSYADYPLPVKANIDFARRREATMKQRSFIAKAHPEMLIEFEDILGGTFQVDNEEKLRFIPRGTRTRLSMDESSSSVRSLLDLGLYLVCVANPGDLLIIDEPELNLHPKNQRRVSRLLARVANAGVRVLITTHSDYVVKELNLLLLMNSDDERVRHIAEQERYHRHETLHGSAIRVYVAKQDVVKKQGKQRRSIGRTLTEVPVTVAKGIEISSFDQEINDMNRIEDRLIYGE